MVRHSIILSFIHSCPTMRSGTAAAAAVLVLGSPAHVGAFQIPARTLIVRKIPHRSTSSLSPLASSSTLALPDDDSSSGAAATGLAIPRWQRFSRQFRTLLRVGFPSVVAGVVATLIFPALARLACTVTNSAQVFTLLTPAATDYTGQFLSVIGLLYSLLVGQTYSFVYSQQEAIYYALFNEVTEAKSLLEQVALVCQGRAMYPQVLRSMKSYVRNDLKQVKSDPAILLSRRPADDPLESIMYLTSVGIPGHIYETIRSLRQARAARLGALQRKVPNIHMGLLWILASIMLITFPLLGAASIQAAKEGAKSVLTVEGCLFGVTAFAVTLTKMLVGELLRPAGGAYNVDAVLGVMVRGLEKELDERLEGKIKNTNSPSTPLDFST